MNRAEALKAIPGAFLDVNDHDRIGIESGESVVWIRVAGMSFETPETSAAILAQRRRVSGVITTATIKDAFDRQFAPPPMDFIPSADPIPGDSGRDDTAPIDMGRAADKPKKVLGGDDLPPLPAWIDGSTGEVHPPAWRR